MKSALCAFSSSGIKRSSRSSAPTCARSRRSSAGAVIRTTASKRVSPPTSYSSGTSVAQTAGGSSTVASASRQSRYSATTRGCKRLSSHASASRSPKTMFPIARRSTLPASSRIASPNRSRSAERTCSSSRNRLWTMASLESVAAPWRADEGSASVFPPPMPPVIAAATGRGTLFAGFWGRSRRLALGVAGPLLLGGRLIGRDALISELGRDIVGVAGRCGRRFATTCGHVLRPRRLCLWNLDVPRDPLAHSAFADRRLRLREDLLGKIEIRRPRDRLRIVGTRNDAATLDALEREGKPPPLGIDLDDLRLHLVALRDDLTGVLDVVLRQLRDVHEPFDAGEDLDERTKGDDLRHLALDLVALVVLLEHLLPGIGLRLLQPEGDPLALAIDVEHLHL